MAGYYACGAFIFTGFWLGEKKSDMQNTKVCGTLKWSYFTGKLFYDIFSLGFMTFLGSLHSSRYEGLTA